MQVRMCSVMTGRWNKMDLPVTPEELRVWQSSGKHVQDYFPRLSKARREFLISGVTPEEWATIPEEPDWDDEDAASAHLD